MQIPSMVETTLAHPGTGRRASVLCVENFGCAPPVSVAAGKYVLLVASGRASIHFTEAHARAWVEAGASYICAWGPAASELEEAFDYAAFLPELGEPLPFTLMTTSHKNETLQEALWFAFYNGKAPDEAGDGACPVVVVVDSKALEAQSVAWMQRNTE